MSFPRANIKRFNDDAGCAPPPGTYNPKHSYKLQGVNLDGVERFKENKGCPAANESTLSTTPVKRLFAVPQVSASKKSAKVTSKKADDVSKSAEAKPKVSGRDQDEIAKVWISIASQLELFDTLTGSLERLVESYTQTIKELDTTKNLKHDKKATKKDQQKKSNKDSLVALNDGTVKTDTKLQLCKKHTETIEGRFITALTEHSSELDKVKIAYENRKRELMAQIDELMKNKDELNRKLEDVQKNFNNNQSESCEKIKQLEERELVLNATTRNMHERIIELQAANEDLLASLKETEELLCKNKLHNTELEEMINASELKLENSKKEYLTQIENLVFEKSKTEADLGDRESRLKCLHNDFERHKTEADGCIQTLTSQLDQRNTEFQQLQDKLGTLVYEKSQLHSEIGHLEAQMKLIKSTSEQTKVEAEKALEVVPELMARLEAVNLEKTAADECIKELRKENAVLQRTLETCQTDFDDYVRKIDLEKSEYQTKILSQSDEIDGLKEQKDQMAKELDDWLTDKSELEIEVAKLQCRIKVLEMDLEQNKQEYEGDMKKKEEEMEKIQEKNLQKIKEEKFEVEKNLQKIQEDYSTMEKNLEKMQEEKSRMEKNLDKIQEEKSTMEKNLEKVQEERSTIEKNLEKVQEEKSTMEKNLEKVEEEKSTIEKNLEKVQEEKSTMEKNMEQYGIDLLSNAAQLQTIQAQLASKEKDYETLLEEMDGLEEDLRSQKLLNEDLQTQFEKTRADFIKKSNECEEVSKKLSETETNLQTSSKQVSNYKQQIEDYLEHLQLKCDECEELQEKCEELDSELTAAAKDVVDLTERVESLTREHATKTSELVEQYEGQIEDMKSQLSTVSMNKDTEEELARFKALYEELQKKVEPFLEQINAFELEKQTLLGMNKNTQAEMEKLSSDYARLLGHQNQKQKIKHIMKIKEENSSLKNETMQLRAQITKQKQTIKKLEEKNAPKRFDATKAFSHSKENQSETEKPKTPLKDVNRK